MGWRGDAWPWALGVSMGAFLGLGVFTFGYAKGGSYLLDDPQACANCHVMQEQLNGWRKSTHRQAAVCNDCHTPGGWAPKYFTKAWNGVHHSLAFTTGRFPDVIRITLRNAQITEAACLKCHAEITDTIRGFRSHPREPDCVRCHRHVGHAH